MMKSAMVNERNGNCLFHAVSYSMYNTEQRQVLITIGACVPVPDFERALKSIFCILLNFKKIHKISIYKRKEEKIFVYELSIALVSFI